MQFVLNLSLGYFKFCGLLLLVVKFNSDTYITHKCMLKMKWLQEFPRIIIFFGFGKIFVYLLII